MHTHTHREKHEHSLLVIIALAHAGEKKKDFTHRTSITGTHTHTDILSSLKGLTCFLYLRNKLNVGLDTCRAADVWVSKVRPVD